MRWKYFKTKTNIKTNKNTRKTKKKGKGHFFSYWYHVFNYPILHLPFVCYTICFGCLFFPFSYFFSDLKISFWYLSFQKEGGGEENGDLLCEGFHIISMNLYATTKTLHRVAAGTPTLTYHRPDDNTKIIEDKIVRERMGKISFCHFHSFMLSFTHWFIIYSGDSRPPLFEIPPKVLLFTKENCQFYSDTCLFFFLIGARFTSYKYPLYLW